MTGTIGLLLGGGATAVGGLVLARGSDECALDDVGLGMFCTGIAAVLVSDVLITMAPHHAVDAVNIYNDGVDRAAKPPLATVPPRSEAQPQPR